MTRTMTLPVSQFSPTELALWSWFVFGAVAMLLIPQARGMSDLFGWMPFWLVAAPLLDLLLVHRSRVWNSLRVMLTRIENLDGRRRRRPQRQARAIRSRRTSRAGFGAKSPGMALAHG